MVSGPVPKKVHVRAEQCGFGDTLLLSFEYGEDLDDGRRERHVFIDFGSSHWPKKDAPTHAEIARDVEQRTNGRLDAIVVTHRHKDHLSGYGDDEAGEIIAGLKPRIVLRPWTEDPDLPARATGPEKSIGADSQRMVRGLEAAQELAAEVHGALDGARGLRRDLAMMAAHQLPNKAAVERLNQLSDEAELGGRYLYAGQDSGLEQVLPGVEVKVLGPPTPEQWPPVASQKADDPEYWLGQRGRLLHMLDSAEEPGPAAPAVSEETGAIEPGPARWLIEKMKKEQTTALLRIVRSLDEAMNNTSLILYFAAGRRRLLFPGDAQIENWSYALQDGKAAELGADLADVDLYKVGHHGSRNATPRSLVEMWRKAGQKVTSVMSTMHGVHGKTEATAVPRSTLVEALESLGPLQSTDALEEGVRFVELSGSTGRQSAYEVTEGSSGD